MWAADEGVDLINGPVALLFGGSTGKPGIGAVTNCLLSISRNGSDVSAVGCMYTYGAASPDGKGEYEAHGAPIGAPEGGVSAFKVAT